MTLPGMPLPDDPEGGHDASPFVPPGGDVAELAAAAARCRGCPLHRHTTGTVFGRGPAPSPLMLVGEQPGDMEDRQGEPFVGPAGRLLAEIMEEIGLRRDTIYLTNAVKHFKFTERGKRRIHQTPTTTEVGACGPWLAAELDAVSPSVVVALGTTAARGVLHRAVRVGAAEGEVFPLADREVKVIVSLHPSALLRADDEDRRAAQRSRLTTDLVRGAELAGVPLG